MNLKRSLRNKILLFLKGWHIPSNAEWATLIGNIGGMDNAGGKLKEIGISQWLSPNTGATNETGFTAIPGNYRGTYGDYSKDGYLCYWWSTNEDPNHSNSGASYWGVYYDNPKLFPIIFIKM
ncbi:MAG TPA: FISUMP domain-containing protein [Prolixibacteraceae bacterium]|nr:FISUMP domain-containing protein [Prolixibacteraceae bacterium]